MGGFERFCWILTILASIGALAILGTALSGHGLAAPDQAVLAVAGAGVAIVPYIFTRAIQALGRDARERAAARALPAAPSVVAPGPAAEARLRETPPPETPSPETPSPEMAPPDTPLLLVPTEPVPGAGLAIELPAVEPEPEPPRAPAARERLFPRPLAVPADPAPSQTERPIELPAGEPRSEPPRGLVAKERLVPPPPPPPRRSALERAFWILIGILVVIIVVGIILIRNGP